MTLAEIDQMLRALELLPHTDDFRVDQAIGLAHDRLLMMWAEATRAAERALDAGNVPSEEHLEAQTGAFSANWRATR